MLFLAQWKTHMNAKQKEIQLWFVVAGTERIITSEETFLLYFLQYFRLYSVQELQVGDMIARETQWPNVCCERKDDKMFAVRFLTAINFLTFSLDSEFWQVWRAFNVLKDGAWKDSFKRSGNGNNDDSWCWCVGKIR